MVVLNILVEDASGDPATMADAADWGDAYGLSFDVLADTEEVWATAWGDPTGGRYVQHSYTVLNSDGTVAWHLDGYENSTLDDIVDAVEAAD